MTIFGKPLYPIRPDVIIIDDLGDDAYDEEILSKHYCNWKRGIRIMNPKTLCIYHGNCADGFGAAWVVRESFRRAQLTSNIGIGEDLNIDFHAGVYQSPPPDVTGRDVILVDFSYKRAIVLDMLEKCNSLIIIDHHKSAIQDLNGIEHPKFISYFDEEHSGAMLTWLYYFGQEEPPELLKHIEDRDLWRFNLPKTREIQANLFSYPYDFDVWDILMDSNVNDLSMIFAKEGEAIERKHFKDIKELLTVSQRRAIIGSFDVPIANLPYTLSSDAGHAMNENEPFAACYMDTKEGRVFSLRSRFPKSGVDVQMIAKIYGGGGHPAAAGFKITYDKLDLIPFTTPIVI